VNIFAYVKKDMFINIRYLTNHYLLHILTFVIDS